MPWIFSPQPSSAPGRAHLRTLYIGLVRIKSEHPLASRVDVTWVRSNDRSICLNKAQRPMARRNKTSSRELRPYNNKKKTPKNHQKIAHSPKSKNHQKKKQQAGECGPRHRRRPPRHRHGLSPNTHPPSLNAQRNNQERAWCSYILLRTPLSHFFVFREQER